jgi:triosephosphate isomerase (TIM)
VKKFIIAYEPVWAIGKRAKDAMQPTDLTQMVIFIRKVLSDIFGREAAESVPLLYGGSVESSNAKELMETGVSGFLVGHASLDAKSFANIAEALIS